MNTSKCQIETRNQCFSATEKGKENNTTSH